MKELQNTKINDNSKYTNKPDTRKVPGLKLSHIELLMNITNRDLAFDALAQRDQGLCSGHTRDFLNLEFKSSIKCSLSRAYNLINIVYGPVVK